jgi:hypothetical protein
LHLLQQCDQFLLCFAEAGCDPGGPHQTNNRSVPRGLHDPHRVSTHRSPR